MINDDTDAGLKKTFNATKEALISLADAMRVSTEADDYEAMEAAEEAIQCDPLSIEVRDGWRSINEQPGGAIRDFRMLLSTGGPASRIVGTLDEFGCVETFVIEVQNWFQPWTTFSDLTEEQSDAIKHYYLSQFYFGE